MHPAAYEWVRRFATSEPVAVLDIGGRNINGSVRDLFPGATKYVAVDLYPGEGVDVVSDVTLWDTDDSFDVVVCCEVLEHAPNWREIVRTAHARCKDGGTFLMTCAGPGRGPHSGVDGNDLQPGEHYENIDPGLFEKELTATGWTSFLVDTQGYDLRAVAIR